MSRVPRPLAVLCWLAGSCDLATGTLLVLAPSLTLGLMGISPLPLEPIYLRFVGAFVGSVGASYLYPWVLAPERRGSRVATVLEVTAGVRIVVGGFVLAAVLSSALVPAWLSVAATDWTLAALQLALLTRARRGERNAT